MLTDRPDRWVDVGVDRQTGFIVLLVEHIGDVVTRHAEAVSMELDPDIPDEPSWCTCRGMSAASTDPVVRCPWGDSSPHMRDYHDHEWGRPVHDDRRLFEMLCLEGAQAGLAWDTILRRREGYRAAYEGFDAATIAGWDDARQAELLLDPRIIRNRAKVAAFRDNARATLDVRDAFGSFDAYLWRFVDGRPIVNRPARQELIPALSPASEALSRDLRARGLPVRGARHHVRLHAVDGPRGRPHRGLLRRGADIEACGSTSFALASTMCRVGKGKGKKGKGTARAPAGAGAVG